MGTQSSEGLQGERYRNRRLTPCGCEASKDFQYQLHGHAFGDVACKTWQKVIAALFFLYKAVLCLRRALACRLSLACRERLAAFREYRTGETAAHDACDLR